MEGRRCGFEIDEPPVVGGLAGVVGVGGAVDVGAAPGAVPDAGIDIGVVGAGVLLPLVPGHGGIGGGERPDERAVERGPDAAVLGFSGHESGPVDFLADLFCADLGGLAEEFVDCLDEGLGLVGRGALADDGPGLAVEPHSLFSDPAIRRRGRARGA